MTANRTEIGLLYFAAVVQGLALVTFPAASAIFTEPARVRLPARNTARCSSRRWCWRSSPPRWHPGWRAAGPAWRVAARVRRQLRVNGAAGLERTAGRRAGYRRSSCFGLPLARWASASAPRVMALNTSLRRFSRRRRRRGADAERAARGWHCAGAGSGGYRRWRRRLVAAARRGGVHARGARSASHSRSRCNGPAGARRQQPDADRFWEPAEPVLALCRRRVCLRHSRDDERQLGNGVSERQSAACRSRGPRSH